ncbi:MAG: GLPGLI family protein [Bacteroidota bacterium]|nr:GLPGLI family protein [Bacteroidota bacterium]
MQKSTLLTVILFFCLSQLTFAQAKSGKVTYLVKSGIDLNDISSKIDSEPDLANDLSSGEKDKMKAILSMMLSGSDSEEVLVDLYFNQQASIIETQDFLSESEFSLNIAAIAAEKIDGLFMNYNDGVTYMVSESLGEKLIIIDSLNRFKWVLGNEKKEIQGFNCLKAVGTRIYDRTETSKVVAWYTPEIPIPTGPAGYGGLPGMILELNEIGYVSYQALEIETDLNKKSLKRIELPKRGKLISRNEYWDLWNKIENEDY